MAHLMKLQLLSVKDANHHGMCGFLCGFFSITDYTHFAVAGNP